MSRNWLAALLLLGSCNRYEMFRLAGYQQESFSNKADVLFVIDNSDSMLEESASLAVNFGEFINALAADEDVREREDLSDAVDNFVDYVQNRAAFVDFQFGITTTDVEADKGRLLGPVNQRSDDDISESFISTLLCEATCFPPGTSLIKKPNHSCGDPIGNELSEEFMDCTCGGGGWDGECGATREEGVEAVFMALCQAVPNPPTACFEDIDNGTEQFSAILKPSDTLKNEGLLRPNANFIPVIVSDEGDGSRRMHREGDGEKYARLFEQFGMRTTWVYIGQRLDEDNKVACPSPASDWGVQRYTWLAHQTGGTTVDIKDQNCNDIGFDEALGELGDLLVNLLTRFQLQSVPDPTTITVVVDGKSVSESELLGADAFGVPEYSAGWTYEIDDNSIRFHGDSTPEYDSNVQVYYLPVDGMPRELPF